MRLRERLRRQASRRVGRLLDDFDRRADELESVQPRSDEEVAARIAALEARLKEARAIDFSKLPSLDLLDDVRSALLLPDASWNRPPPPPSFVERLRAAFARFVALSLIHI